MEKQRKHMKMSIVQQVELVLGQSQETIGHGECREAKKARSDASVWHDMLPFRWGWNFLQITKYLSMDLHGFKADFHNLSFTKPSCENCTSKQIHRIPTKIHVIFSNLSPKISIPMQNFTNISKKLLHIFSQFQPTPRKTMKKNHHPRHNRKAWWMLIEEPTTFFQHHWDLLLKASSLSLVSPRDFSSMQGDENQLQPLQLEHFAP